MDFKQILKGEGASLLKTLGAIAASLAAVWTYAEPVVEDYVHNQIEIVHQEDLKEINQLKGQIEVLEKAVEENGGVTVSMVTLLSDKMNVDEDEVHIELGKLYRKNKSLYVKVDSLRKQVDLDYSHGVRMRRKIQEAIKSWHPESTLTLDNN